MANDDKSRNSDLFIVDNSDSERKVLDYLHEWTQIPQNSLDIATGYFEIGSLLRLDRQWQKLDKIRILMGEEVTRRTKDALLAGLATVTNALEASIEKEKQTNDFLLGVPSIVEALRTRKIECRVYTKLKFHAKAYLTHPQLRVIPPSALVGSSNFTYPGMTQNVELNVHFDNRHRREVELLQEWYNQHWQEAEDVTDGVFKVIERHVREYAPFDVYAKSLQEYFRNHEMTADEWEKSHSKIYQILAPYQREGYHALLKIARDYNGAFLCDGVGLGKTFVGLMLIERLVLHDRLNVALFVPKSAREAVWESVVRDRLPQVWGEFGGLRIFNHSDLLRGGEFPRRLSSIRDSAHVIIVDEAHHFRNTGTRGESESDPRSRYWKLYDIAEGKKLFLLTATPINNRLTDLQHLIELFSRHKADYFSAAPLGIHSLAGHFRKMEKSLEKAVHAALPNGDEIETNQVEAEQILAEDDLFRTLVVQRSRAYVKKSAAQEDSGEILFPKPREPQVVPYSVKQTYGKLLGMVEAAFNKTEPLFSLPIYYPFAKYRITDDPIDPLAEGRQKQVVTLIRTQFLKRFESSVEAFTMSCWNLLRKLLAWVEVHAKTQHEVGRLERWKRAHGKLIGYMQAHQLELFGGEQEVDGEDDLIPPEMLAAVEKLERSEFKVDEIIDVTLDDMNQLADFLNELQNFKPSQDKKLTALVNLLKKDRVAKEHKVIIFTEFLDTARYLHQQLEAAGITGVAEIDSANANHKDRTEVIRRFAPYYNGLSSSELAAAGKEEIRVLISTDVLAEGLNLQDATRLINYDLHWNPVRLMQRIGRIDRRMNPAIESRLVADHPEQAALRGEVGYWNFLPPNELNDLLRLYETVSKKTLRISRTFGIEGKKLLKPDDDYEDLRDFYHAYEGTESPIEKMRLEWQQLQADDKELADRLNALPPRVFSGKASLTPGARAVFFCYVLPAPESDDATQWTESAGIARWFLFDLATEQIAEDAHQIINFVRCLPGTPRSNDLAAATLTDVRAKVERHIKNSYFKKIQAPANVKPALKAWMELV
ncbi:MAG: helicase [Acidobacteria bacterium]|nr:helicase [Acidobacteriota bacterium]